MKLDKEAIDSIAKLSKLTLSEPEKKQYAEQLSTVLDFVEQLKDVDTDTVTETTQVTGLEDVMREDVSVDCPEDLKEGILNQFPEKEGDLLKVKAVFN